MPHKTVSYSVISQVLLMLFPIIKDITTEHCDIFLGQPKVHCSDSNIQDISDNKCGYAMTYSF